MSKTPTDKLAIRPIKVKESEEDKVPKNNMHDEHVLPNHPARVMFVGPSASGKTTLIINLLRNNAYFRRYFDVIYVFSPSWTLDRSWRALDAWTADQRKEKSTDSLVIPFEDYDMEKLEQLVNAQRIMVKENGRENTKALFLFDDSVANNELMNNKNFVELFLRGRHGNASTWIATQQYNMVPKKVRAQMSNLFIYACTSEECKAIGAEWRAQKLSNRDFKNLLDFCTAEDYGFMHINNQDTPSRRYRKGLLEIVNLSSEN
jgi:hypothetical protein